MTEDKPVVRNDEPRAIVSMPYHERQLITVGKAEEARPSAWKSLGQGAAAAIAGYAAVTAPFVVLPIAAGGYAVYRFIDRRNQATKIELKSTRHGVLVVTATEAARLSFPVGHFRTGFAYVGHPLTPERYLLVADFHRRMFEEKVVELMRILAALGAVHTEINVMQGWGDAISGGINLSEPFAGVNLAFGAGGGKEKFQHIVFTAISPNNKGNLFPRDLAWFQAEPIWQQLVRQRIDNALDEVDFYVSYDDDFGVTAELSASVTAVGYSIGGSFQEKRSTTWRVRASFSG